jgi:hypothetical protein
VCARDLAHTRQRTCIVLALACDDAQACTPYTYIHTYIHVHDTHSHTHTKTHTHTQTHTHICIHTYIHTYIHTLRMYMACMLGRAWMLARLGCEFADARMQGGESPGHASDTHISLQGAMDIYRYKEVRAPSMQAIHIYRYTERWTYIATRRREPRACKRYTHIHAYIHIYIYMYVCVCACVCVCVCTNICMHIHTYIHTIYLYTYLYIYLGLVGVQQSWLACSHPLERQRLPTSRLPRPPACSLRPHTLVALVA